MTPKAFEALKDIVRQLKYSNETNDFSYFILNPNPTRGDIVELTKYIKEVEELSPKN